MNTIEKRDYIHNYLYKLDDNNIDELFKKIRSVVEDDITLTRKQEEELDRRLARHKNGESKSFSWTETKNRIRKEQ